MTCRQCGHQWCWLCLGRYEGGHFNQGLCEGLQFGAFDSIEEALADRGMSIEEARARAQQEAEDRERVQREREEYERSPAGIAARRRREKEAKKRRRKRKAKKIAKYTALAPVVIVGGAVVGVVALGALAVIAPIALVGAAFN